MGHKPEMAHFAVTMDDGSTAIFGFVTQGRSPTLPSGAAWTDGEAGEWFRPANDQNVADELAKTSWVGPRPISWRRINVNEIPQDRTFRDAWVDRNGKIDHDMPKARAIHLDRLRGERKGQLDALDAEWMRATGQGKKADADAVEAKRQRLRDLPDVTACTTVEELKRITLPEV